MSQASKGKDMFNLERLDAGRRAFEEFGNSGLPLVSGIVSPLQGSDVNKLRYCVNLVKEPVETGEVEATAIPTHLLRKLCLIHAGANVTGFTYRIKPSYLELKKMTLKKVKDMTREMGIREEKVDVVDEEDEPKLELLKLILAELHIEENDVPWSSYIKQEDDSRQSINFEDYLADVENNNDSWQGIEYEDESWLSLLAHDTSFGLKYPEYFQRHGYTPRVKGYRKTHRYARVQTHNTYLSTIQTTILALVSEVLEVQGAVSFIKMLSSDGSGHSGTWSPAFVFGTSYTLTWVVRLVLACYWVRKRLRRDMHPAEGGFESVRGDLMTFSFEPLVEDGQRKCRMLDQRHNRFERILFGSCLQKKESDNDGCAHREKDGYARLSWTSFLDLILKYLIFELLAVPKDTMYLHLNMSPFSHIKRWCAFQKDGVRANIVIYPFRNFWMFENLASNRASYYAQGFSSMMQTLIRIWVYVSHWQLIWKEIWWLVFYFLVSLNRALGSIGAIKTLKKCEKQVKKYLKDRLEWCPAALAMWQLYGFGPLPPACLPQPLADGTPIAETTSDMSPTGSLRMLDSSPSHSHTFRRQLATIV